jgi:two-component system, cell cycle sensor histidine kinase and response regulator CckA
VEMHLDGNVATINADPTQMEQVLMNLAVNAKDAMPEGGTLTIETNNVTLDEDYCRLHLDARPGEYVRLAVSDTGQGMDTQTLEHIFEPFFSTKDPGKGTGLGLSIVYGIVKQHGGHVTCDSNPGRGTTFRIYLPVIARMAERPDLDETTIPAGGSETILVVDDEEPVRKLAQSLLTTFGYGVLVAASGQEALDLYKREGHNISLVILDVVMQKMKGTECLEKLLEINPSVKVLIASGYPADENIRSVGEARAKGFISKPYEGRKLLRTVREVLDAQ